MSNETPPISSSVAATTSGVSAATSSAASDSATSNAGGAAPFGRRRSDRMVGASEATRRSTDQITVAARSRHPVLITGERGVGKTHAARAIHAWSARAEGPFATFSAAGIPATDQALQLFGSVAESGAIEAAAGGSLLVAALPSLDDNVLAALLSAIATREFRREGSGESIPMDARVLFTSSDSDDTRLGGLELRSVSLAPLSERSEDIAPLAAHFLALFAEEEGVRPIGFTADARTWLLEESWSANVRSLREQVRQAVRLSKDGAISAESLMLSGEGEEIPSFKQAKRAFETRYVEGLLRRCGGNISRAARLAKKDRKDFYDVIRRTGVNPSEFRS